MTRLITKKITIIGLIILVLTIKPILAHTGHNHSKPDTKRTKIEQEENKTTENNTQSSPNSETKQPQTAATKPINITLQPSNQFNLIPQTSEIIFLLLVANPIILKIIKKNYINNK